MQCGHDERVSHTPRRRHGHDDLLDAGYLGRDDGHQNGRRICGLSARDVFADAIQRGHSLTQTITVCIFEIPRVLDAVLLLVLVIRIDARGSMFQRLSIYFRQLGESGLAIRCIENQLGHAGTTDVVEPVGIFHQCRVTASADLVDDLIGYSLDLAAIPKIRVREFGKRIVELRIPGVQAP